MADCKGGHLTSRPMANGEEEEGVYDEYYVQEEGH